MTLLATSGEGGPGGPVYPIAKLLKWLLTEYGGAGDLPRWDDPHRNTKLTALTALSRNTVADLCTERTRGVPPRQETCARLARIFRRAIPGIRWEWFRATSAEEFQRLLAGSAGDWKTVSITVPRTSACPLEELQKLPGYYLTYRYSIDRSQNRYVAREVIEITEKDDEFRFRMSFRTGGSGEEDGELMWFEGVVLPVGQSLCFTGWETERVRSIFFRWDKDSVRTPYHLGMMSSTKRGMPYYPIAACTLMVRLQSSLRDEERFVEAATRIAAFQNVIEEDFGTDSLEAIRAFLDNSISSIRADGVAPEESVLRINEDRFAARMPDIYRQAMARGKAPFVSDWKPWDRARPATKGNSGQKRRPPRRRRPS